MKLISELTIKLSGLNEVWLQFEEECVPIRTEALRIECAFKGTEDHIRKLFQYLKPKNKVNLLGGEFIMTSAACAVGSRLEFTLLGWPDEEHVPDLKKSIGFNTPNPYISCCIVSAIKEILK